MDWNQDGKDDIISGCYWTDGEDGAHLQILTGNGAMDFNESKSIASMNDKPLQNVDVSDANQIQAICTEQHAVDYDNDGDLDLVVGCFGSNFYYYENKAESNGQNSIVDEPIELPVAISGHHAAPHLVDWDNDGDLDLLSGAEEGGVTISENTGTRAEPVWAKFQSLIPASNSSEQSAGELEIGPYTRVWATDWNGDGWQDLLVGDRVSVNAPADGISMQEWEKRRKADNATIEQLSQKANGLYKQLEAVTAAGKEPDGELAKSIENLQSKMDAALDSKAQYESSKMTGHVWLLIRKPPTDAKLTASN